MNDKIEYLIIDTDGSILDRFPSTEYTQAQSYSIGLKLVKAVTSYEEVD